MPETFDVHLPLPDEAVVQHITVLFFGQLAVHIGMNQIEWHINHSLPMNMLVVQLAQRFGNWHAFPQPLQALVNRELVVDTAMVNAGDEVAFIPV